MIYREVIGDLFLSNGGAIAHCVSSDLKMGKGIALEFRRRFGHVDTLKAQQGPIRVLTNLGCYSHIFYLVTKEKYYDKPTYQSMAYCLYHLRDIVIREHVSSLSIPLLGCGLDRLEWEQVRNLLMSIFSSVDVSITVYRK